MATIELPLLLEAINIKSNKIKHLDKSPWKQHSGSIGKHIQVKKF